MRAVLFAVLILFLALSCTAKSRGTGTAAADETPAEDRPAWAALALLETGENPLWFELGPEGPALIESPAAASLEPYAPWPHARFVTGMRIWEGFLVMAVNRYGFVILGPGHGAVSDTVSGAAFRPGAAMLYRVSANGLWDPYTAESFFTWTDKPVVLLYRNVFFADSAAPSPRPQVYALDRQSPVPLGVTVPALENRSPSREAEVVRRGAGGFWYYRVKEKGVERNKLSYFRTADLGEEGLEISPGEWRNSDRPEAAENAPSPLAAVLERAAAELGGNPVIRAISPHFDSPRLYCSAATAAAADGEMSPLLHGFYDEKNGFLAISGGGRGFYSAGTGQDIQSFSLPALPEDFVYSGAALLSSVLTLTWEEQQEAGVGAAGFMVIRAMFQ